ncbi:hypothetical protein TNCV_1922781 [Trichonephila clavipes]|nr:hypothetical protein TNCV_1922781 [Trichonephila clavipes]
MVEHLVMGLKTSNHIGLGSALETGGRRFLDQYGQLRRLNQVNLSGFHRSQAKGMLLLNASNLSSYKRRLERLAGILKFQELLKMYPVPVKMVKNENGFHITDCVWSTENCTEGSDTCECYFLFKEPDKYFIVKPLDHVVVRDGSIHHKDCLTKAHCQCGRIPSLF